MCMRGLLQALPACKAHPDDPGASDKQTIIWRDGEYVCLRMARRKNRPGGSGTLMRMCSCGEAGGPQDTCLVHNFYEKYWESLPDGHEPWKKMSEGFVRTALRRTLSRLGVQEAESYGTHDFRRGHAEVCSLRVL